MEMISVLMPTYGRPPRFAWFLEEAIECYYRNASRLTIPTELIVCNDTPGQILVLAEPRPDVRIFNLDKRFENLGDKLNWMVDKAKGTIICRWDDDDINLPHGLKWRYDKMKELGLDGISPKRFFAICGKRTSFGFGSFAQVMCKKSVHQAIGGYKGLSFAEDQDYENRIKAAGFKFSQYPIHYTEAFYCYTWGQGSYHLSGFGRHGDGWSKIGKRSKESGTFVLKPQWYQDYDKRVEEARENYRVKCAQKDKAEL